MRGNTWKPTFQAVTAYVGPEDPRGFMRVVGGGEGVGGQDVYGVDGLDVQGGREREEEGGGEEKVMLIGLHTCGEFVFDNYIYAMC